MSQSNVPQHSDIKAIREMTKLPQEQNDSATITMLKDRRKLVADYYYNKSYPIEIRQQYFDELALLHEYFGFKKVWPLVKSNGNNPAKQTRSIEEKKEDIKTMYKFCWELALEKAKIVYPTAGKDQYILAEHFNKQFTNNWIS